MRRFKISGILAAAIALLLISPIDLRAQDTPPAAGVETPEQPQGGLRGWWKKAFVRWGGAAQGFYAYDLREDSPEEDLFDARFKASAYLDINPWTKARMHISALGGIAFDGRIPNERVKPEWTQRTPLEAYLTQSIWKIDATVGYQNVKWGINEFLSPTDNLNPLDMRGFVDPDREDVVIPIPMITAKLFITDFIFIEGVAIPFFARSRFHEFGTDFALCQPGVCPVTADENVHDAGPDTREISWEYGARLHAQVSDFTGEISYFNTREDFPVFASVQDTRTTYTEIIIERRYPTYEVIGGGLAWRYKKAALRVEGAYSPERYYTTFKDFFFNMTGRMRPILYPKPSPYYTWAAEVEYSPSRRLFLMGGYSEFVLTDPPPDLLISSKYMNIALLMLRATALRERLVLKFGVVYFLQNDEYVLLPRIAYAFSNKVELSAGINYLAVKHAGTQQLGGIAPVSLFEHDSNAFVGVRYSF